MTDDPTPGDAPMPGTVEVLHATLADQLPIRRMLELYQHDLSDIWDQDLDVHGEYGYALERYWDTPVHQAFVFRVQDHYAGFALVNDDVCLSGNHLWMAQFFVLKKYRRRGLGAQAAHAVFDSIRGRWEVGQMPGNHAAHAFWLRTIGQYTGGRFTQHELADKRWHGWLQCFDNARRETRPDADT